MNRIQKKYIMFPHGGSGNHGCEAIVRTTVDLLGMDKNILLFSDCIDEDIKYIKEFNYSVLSPLQEINKKSFKYLKAIMQYRLLNRKDAYDREAFDPIISSCEKDDILLSIGGDNYCYGDNDYIYLVNRYARKKGCKTVLWGCSIGREDLTEKMILDLELYNLIIARESLSYNNLKRINPNTVLIPDPAFTLKKSKGIIPNGLASKQYIGINISPMIRNNEKIEGITMKNYLFLIEKIINETKYNIALIPHVVKRNNDDRSLINELYNFISDKSRVYIVEDQNCLQLKDIISKCECFIGARTHSTIAAYSECIPTLVVGYSVKAKGIAKDLFGTDEGYVLPVQNLLNENDLYNAFQWIWNNRTQIKRHLNYIMPRYIDRVSTINKVLAEKLY